MRARVSIILVLMTVFSTSCFRAEGTEDLPLHLIRLPPGFAISVYAADVPNARSMALGTKGTLFVGTRTEGKVYAVLDRNGDKKADEVITIAEGLNMPNGVAFRDGSLYVAEINRVIRFADIENHLNNPPEPTVINNSFPSNTHHGWKFIRFGPDAKLYVPVGMPCNICVRDNPIYGTITRMNADGSNMEIYASGVRNSVGFDWNPLTKVLWFTDNGRDWLGDDAPPDELNRAPRKGMNFGFPFCYGGNIPDPTFQGQDCDAYTPPALDLEAHVAPLGMRFYTGDMFPPKYGNRIFIAEHGSWNRSVPIGYRVMVVQVEEGRPVKKEIFAEGWLQHGSAWGRPVDVQVMPDGALLVSDDRSGTIYRITYARP